ncbi:cytochrome C oxidase assembly protein [Phaeobacter sp.]|uniref:cytochrome C oxidase assembly protein n=1 Tax=Phaeobacter sp. TaxID=1902409 RepID=UPI0025E63AEE|nr:cytochrome C oxidase assembly protein [Phaeobacter sp.]
MSLRKEHELHHRRKGRNLGVGVLLASFVVLILALTMVKVTSSGFKFPNSSADSQQTEG